MAQLRMPIRQGGLTIQVGDTKGRTYYQEMASAFADVEGKVPPKTVLLSSITWWKAARESGLTPEEIVARWKRVKALREGVTLRGLLARWDEYESLLRSQFVETVVEEVVCGAFEEGAFVRRRSSGKVVECYLCGSPMVVAKVSPYVFYRQKVRVESQAVTLECEKCGYTSVVYAQDYEAFMHVYSGGEATAGAGLAGR